MSRVVVVGAGIGGLAAAARLAAGGHRVVLCEQADTIGGKLGRHVRDGVTFDTGPSLLTLPDVLRETFSATGGWPAGLELERIEPTAEHRFADGTRLQGHGDPGAFAAQLDGPDRAGWIALRQWAARCWETTHEPFLEQELHGVRTLLTLALQRPGDLRRVAPWQTLDGLARRHLRDPRAIAVANRYATYSGSDPRRAPAALAAALHAELEAGAWHVRGGLARIADALAQRATDLGVEIRTGADVARVEVAGGRVDGARLADGELLPADVVVSDADAAAVYGRLLSPAARVRRRRTPPPSYSGFALLLGIRGPRPAGLAHHTVLYPADPAAEFDDLAAGRPVRDPTVYLCAPPDPTMAAAGVAGWFVLVNAPRHGTGTDWHDEVLLRATTATILATLARHGLHVPDRLAFCETRSPADLERATRAPGGAIYGSSSDGPAAAFLRPGNRSPVPGLVLVGGSAHPGGGIPLVLLSARIGARIVGPA